MISQESVSINTAKKTVLSLDIGTTAVKVGLFSITGELLAIQTREQKLLFPIPGRVEQNLKDTWCLITDCVQEIVKEFTADNISAIALAIQRGSVIPLDREGEPLSNQIVWMDNRGIPQVEWLNENVGLEEYYNTSGHGLTHITGVSKLLWLRHADPKVWEKINIVAPPQTLFLKWLGCDDLFCDLSCGTYTFPFDIDRKVWSQKLASKLDYPIEKLPKLVTATEIIGMLSEQAAVELGLQPGIFLVAGGGDGQCAAAGCGVITPGTCMVNIGTGAGVQCFLTKPKRDPACVLSLGAHVVPDGWEMEAHTQASGIVFRWLRDEFGQIEKQQATSSHKDAFDLLVDQARLAPPGAGGLLLIPTFNGTTGPKVELNARGVLIGLSLAHERRHVIRSFLEGITLEIRWMMDSMIETGASITDLRLVGGGARNQYWNQMHADILGHPVSLLKQNEATLVGAAMCAAVAVGEYRNLSEAAVNFVKIKLTIEPNPSNFPVYQSAYENYRETFDLLRNDKIFNKMEKQAGLSNMRLENPKD